MNRRSIPDWFEAEIKERDKTCVYCSIQMIEQVAENRAMLKLAGKYGRVAMRLINGADEVEMQFE